MNTKVRIILAAIAVLIAIVLIGYVLQQSNNEAEKDDSLPAEGIQALEDFFWEDREGVENKGKYIIEDSYEIENVQFASNKPALWRWNEIWCVTLKEPVNFIQTRYNGPQPDYTYESKHFTVGREGALFEVVDSHTEEGFNSWTIVADKDKWLSLGCTNW